MILISSNHPHHPVRVLILIRLLILSNNVVNKIIVLIRYFVFPFINSGMRCSTNVTYRKQCAPLDSDSAWVMGRRVKKARDKHFSFHKRI